MILSVVVAIAMACTPPPSTPDLTSVESEEIEDPLQ